MTTLKKFQKCYFRKMADENGIVAANWASYHVFLKNGTDENKGKSDDPRTVIFGPIWSISYDPILCGPKWAISYGLK